MADRQTLKLILKKLHEAKPEELEIIKKEAAKYFKDVDPKELALAEQELIQEGTERKEMKRLCDVHFEVMKEQLGVQAKGDIDMLKELSHFFLETEKHHKREEEALFPRLEAHGITEPPQIFKEDHVEFMAKKKELYSLIMGEQNDYKKFVEALKPVINFPAQKLADHIFKEDNILYLMALQALDADEWKEVRKKFDAIGYCCFAPADLKNK